MDELSTQLDEENQILASAREFVMGQLNEVDGPMMQQLNFAGKSNTREGVTEMQKAEDQAKQAEMDSLNSNEQSLNEGLSGKASKAQQAFESANRDMQRLAAALGLKASTLEQKSQQNE